MCGICGIVHQHPDQPIVHPILRAMNDTLTHRGPDGEGYFVDAGIGLAMRRLAIIDIAGGQQPMSNEDGTIQVIFNGEIYNHVEIRRWLMLRGHHLTTNCDTEILPHLYEELGDEFPQRLNGMFAIALWDARRHRLLLVRDRLGIKPLYYARVNGSLIFASELRALLHYPGVQTDIDLTAFSQYLTFQHTMPPRTILTGVQKLAAGHMAIFERGALHTQQYWDWQFARETSPEPEDHWVERYRDLLTTSVQHRLMSDVPLGVFLSGGIDSSAIVALMQRLGVADRRTYTIGYPGGDIYGELRHAHLMVNHSATTHHDLIISSQDYIDALCDFGLYIDEPVSDDVGLLFMLLSRRARQDVTVILCGQGADETLGGYTLAWAQSRFDRIRRFQRLPRWLRQSLPELLSPLLPIRTRAWLARGNRPLAALNGTEAHTLAWQFEADDKRRYCPVLHDVADPCVDIVREMYRRSGTDDPLHQILYVYTRIALAENLLMHADKMSMSQSIELRVPFLDHELVELVGRVPSKYLVRREADGHYTTKSLLKRAMRGIVPEAIWTRPKAAFPLPLQLWLQKDMAQTCQTMLLSDSARTSGLYDRAQVAALLNSHQQDPRHETMLQIKNLLFFEVWRQQVLIRKPVTSVMESERITS